ncbi:MAG: GAF and ANTAR domain-containing protein [Acidimicrobiales bacterium]|nr:GAF and ANTAR domain-containing protein [Acidimicrobiales bacterium]HRW39196.1 GAF and ANTAR domain-containing protein [Aquihabitans sp.]
MPDPGASDEAMASLSAQLVSDNSIHATLVRVSELARLGVGRSVEVGVTLVVDGVTDTLVFTDPAISDIDRAQYEAGDGPGLAAIREGEPVLVDSTIASRRFRTFCRAAVSHGVGSVASFPLVADEAPIGSVNHYAPSEAAFEPATIEAAERFAHQASILVANAQAYWDARSRSEHLRRAMDSRATIEQAKGIIMARTGCDDEGAFDLLRQQSQAENRKLREVAEGIVRRAVRTSRSPDRLG